MYVVMKKLKAVKQALKLWNKTTFGNIQQEMNTLRAELAKVQTLIQADPLNHELAVKENSISTQLQRKLDDEESFLKQKSRVDWLHLDDRNSKFFDASMVTRKARNSIKEIQRAVTYTKTLRT